MDERFKIELASPPDREKLVANIFFGDDQWAELNQENGVLSLELYARRDGQFWQLSFDEVIEALAQSKRKLIGD